MKKIWVITIFNLLVTIGFGKTNKVPVMPKMVDSTSNETEKDSIKHSDFIVFTGTNYDPLGNNKVSSLSFEAIAKFDIHPNLGIRIGGYTYKNFSFDSSSINTNYYFINGKGVPKIDTSKIAVQVYSLNKKFTTRSYGVYMDFLWKPLPEYERSRVYFPIKVEYVNRTTTIDITDETSTIKDTLILSQAFLKQNPVIGSRPISKENIFFANYVSNQVFASTGIAFEYSSNKFDLFAQLAVGGFWEYSQANLPTSRKVITQTTGATWGAKILLTLKVPSITFATDIKSLGNGRMFTNVSIGIPFSFNDFATKLRGGD